MPLDDVVDHALVLHAFTPYTRDYEVINTQEVTLVAIYLRSFIDLIVPLLLGVAMIHFVGDVGWLAGAALASAWGYARVTVSNQALDSTTPRQRPLP